MTGEPTNIWTKSLERNKTHYTINASIVFDIGESGDMFEGNIMVFIDNKQFNMESREYQDSLTFDTQERAIDFINDCLAEWGFNVVFWESSFKYDSPPKDLLVIDSIRESYKNSEEN